MSDFLFINQYFWPDEAATSQLLADLTEDLSTMGHSVSVLCGRARYLCEEKLPAACTEHRKVKVIRVHGTDFGRFAWLGRLVDTVTFIFFAYFKLLRLKKQAVVIAMTSPPFLGMLAAKFCRKHGSRLVLWSQDIYPEVAIKLGTVRNKMIQRYLSNHAAKMYKRCDLIVVPGGDMKRLLENQAVTTRIVHVPNWSDLSEIKISSSDSNSFRKQWADKVVLMYSGNIGRAHDPDAMLEVLLQLGKKIPSLQFVLVGSSERHREFARKINTAGFMSLVTLPAQPRSLLGDLFCAADAHLISQRVEANGLLVPSKFYGAVAAGRPVIFLGPPDSELGGLIREHRLGCVFDSAKPDESLQQAANTLTLLKSDTSAAQRIRSWAEEHGARQRRTREFGDLMNQLTISANPSRN